jgi:hypothetical protein
MSQTANFAPETNQRYYGRRMKPQARARLPLRGWLSHVGDIPFTSPAPEISGIVRVERSALAHDFAAA